MDPPRWCHHHNTTSVGACPAESQPRDTPPAGWKGACPAESQLQDTPPAGWKGACPAESQLQDTPPAGWKGACPAESQRWSLHPGAASSLCGVQSSHSHRRHGFLSSLERYRHPAKSHTRDHRHTNTDSTTACCAPATEQKKTNRGVLSAPQFDFSGICPGVASVQP